MKLKIRMSKEEARLRSQRGRVKVAQGKLAAAERRMRFAVGSRKSASAAQDAHYLREALAVEEGKLAELEAAPLTDG